MTATTCSEQREEDTFPAQGEKQYQHFMGDMREAGDTRGAHSLHPYIPFREAGAQRMGAGAKHIVQQSFPKLCPFWGPTPSTPEASAPPQPLAQPLHKHRSWMQRCKLQPCWVPWLSAGPLQPD